MRLGVVLGGVMECGGGLLCEIAGWLQHHGEEVKEAAKPVAVFFNIQLAPLSPIFAWIGHNIEWVIALASLSFGIWRWWVYREAILHERLRAFITDSDARLDPTYRDVVRVLSRPDRRTKLRQPAYAGELASVLKRNSWEPVLRMEGGTHFVERQLTSAIRSIDNRIEIAQSSLTSLRQQRAAAETITAAIAASRAARTRDPIRAKRLDRDALDAYRRVLQLPGHQKDVVAKEGEAFHLLRLGHLAEAAQAYVELEALAEELKNTRQRVFAKSRALRARALILQAKSQRPALAAYYLVSLNLENTAYTIRSAYRPMNDWDAIEDAEIAYAGAFLSYKNGFGPMEARHLDEAEASYQRVRDANNSTIARLSSAKRQLRKAAVEGIERVASAKMDHEYDLAFLFQPPQQSSADGDGGNSAAPTSDELADPQASVAESAQASG